MKMNKKEKRSKRIKKKLLNKYRLIILNEETFEERISFKLTRLNVFVVTTSSALLLIIAVTLIIAFTPLREYIPGYSSSNVKRQTTQLVYQTDSLKKSLEANQLYLESIRSLLIGDIKVEEFNKDSIVEAAKVDTQVLDRISRTDSLLRERVAKEDTYNPLITMANPQYSFFAPVKGTITEVFNPQIKHYAVDVLTTLDGPVKAIADGTVIFAEWSSQTGNVIIIKHTNDLISVYKHNGSLTKSQGAQVKGGEVIATVGNTGEYTTGPHLHFELWRDGFPVNPTNFIDFD